MTSERKFIAENIRRVLLKEYLMKKTARAGFGDLDIQRTPLGTRVTLIAERPGMVIGRKGATIKELTKIVEDDFKFDNPQIEVQEAPNPNLNPQIMAQKLVSALERGWHFRRAGHSTVRQIMGAGAKGCQVIISGKLTGQRHRVEKFKQGHIKFCGEPKKQWMLEGFAVAKKKLGIIGVKVQIMDPNAKLPDEVDIIPYQEVEALIKAQEAEDAAAAAREAEQAKLAAAVDIEGLKEGEVAAGISVKTEADAGEDNKEKKPRKKRETKTKAKAKKADENDEPESAPSPEAAPSPEPVPGTEADSTAAAPPEPAPETPAAEPEVEKPDTAEEPPAVTEKAEPPVIEDVPAESKPAEPPAVEESAVPEHPEPKPEQPPEEPEKVETKNEDEKKKDKGATENNGE